MNDILRYVLTSVPKYLSTMGSRPGLPDYNTELRPDIIKDVG